MTERPAELAAGTEIGVAIRGLLRYLPAHHVYRLLPVLVDRLPPSSYPVELLSIWARQHGCSVAQCVCGKVALTLGEVLTKRGEKVGEDKRRRREEGT
jgi:O-methyltransferase involved in polyketide biosynthesis